MNVIYMIFMLTYRDQVDLFLLSELLKLIDKFISVEESVTLSKLLTTADVHLNCKTQCDMDMVTTICTSYASRLSNSSNSDSIYTRREILLQMEHTIDSISMM